MSFHIAQLLFDEHKITRAQLEEAIRHQRDRGGRVGQILVTLGYADAGDIAALLGKHYGVPLVDLRELQIDPASLQLLPLELAHKYQMLPIRRSATTLTIAVADPTDVAALDAIKFMTGYHIEPVVTSVRALAEAIEAYYPTRRAAGSTSPPLMPVSDFSGELAGAFMEAESDSPDDPAGETPLIRLVNRMLQAAIRRGASDIHVEPYEHELRVRFRIDGVLYAIMSVPLRMREALASRIKIMASLDIAERRLPQDGRIKIRLRDEGSSTEIDLRVSSLPTLFGEKIVLRLLDRSRLILDMTELGLELESLGRLERAISRPWGMVLVTGPTGSGKTSTLYSSIARLNTQATNIVTVEDPVEFNLTGINQVPVRDNIGLNFAAALRAFLRQDPDIILVGEIRDAETAEIAVKAALTGHLVLSTLHTNDAPGTVTRLLNMGIEPFLVATSVNLVCAQRLVRRLCTACRVARPSASRALTDVGYSQEEAAAVIPFDPSGCTECHGTGYRGRVGLFEVMEMTDELKELVLGGASAAELRRQATHQGMLTLRRSGLRKIAAGVTSVEEVLRETLH